MLDKLKSFYFLVHFPSHIHEILNIKSNFIEKKVIMITNKIISLKIFDPNTIPSFLF